MASNQNAAQQVKNNRLIIAVWENKDVTQKRTNIEKILHSGADVNAPSANLKHNTALHIAVKKAEIDIVKLLLENGADVTRTNSLDENPLDIAKMLKGGVGQDIVALLEERMRAIEEAAIEEDTDSDSEDDKPEKNVDAPGPKFFLMQDRNTGVRGHLYETKLLCLVPLRAENDDDIENYYLASNIAGVGVFDDIGFKYNVKGRKKSIRIFLQAKHRDLPKKGRLCMEDVLKPDGDLSLANCFDSFLQIKKKFDPKSGDPMFGESFENVEFNFIIYTSGEESFSRKLIGKNERSPKVHKLIYTGGKKSIFQFDYKDDDIYCITKDVQRMRIKLLAHNFIEFILGEKDKYKHMLEDDLIKKYHCVLEQIAVRLCKVEKTYIEGEFRPELFRTSDPFIVLLKEELCKVMIEKCCIKPTKTREGIVNEFKRLPKEPTSKALSTFIGTVITYDVKNNKLKVLDNVSKRGIKSNEIKQLNDHLKYIHVSPTVIAEAVLKAGEQKLLSTKFKLPPTFGNIDIMIKDSRVAYLVSIFKDFFEVNKDRGEIIINEGDLGKSIIQNSKTTLTEGFIGHNGGIGSAVGNLLLFDINKKVLKFNTARPLSEKAYNLLTELEKVLPIGKKLDDYVIKVNTFNFPRATFSNDEYDNKLAQCFLDRLWFYCNQGKEDDVEKSVKIEIDKYYNEQGGRTSFRFRTHIDSIFSKFHSEVQKWWMVSTENSLASYLTSDSDIFRIAQEGIDSPLLTLHHEMYVNMIKKKGIEFTADVVKKLGLDERTDKIINITTANVMLSAIKIHQHYKNQNNYNFMDLCYVLSLPPEDRDVILDELKVTSVEILIIICGSPRTDMPVNENIIHVINMFKGNKIIFVTANVGNSSTNVRIPDNCISIRDDMNDFIHFDEESRKKFAEEAVITFQDDEICFADLLDEPMVKVINAKMLSNLMDNNQIEIGRTLMNKKYEEIKDFYVPRRLMKNNSDDLYPINCLDDIEDKVVTIITKHGMGKSTLMTHIALESKKTTPTRWIVRINLADFTDDFYTWQKQRTKIEKVNALKLLCMESLKHVDRKTDFNLIERDGVIVLDTHTSNAMDGMALLELELFLHYYNERKITFLFYGFDYVCPPFGVEAMGLLKILQADDTSMWVASHLAVMSTKVLEEQFGTSYNLQAIDETGQMGFFYKFWKTNIQLEKINTEVCSIIMEFIELMSGKNLHNKQDRMLTPWISLPLHMLYLLAIDFFQTELSNFSFEHVHKTMKEHLDIDLNRGSKLSSYMDKSPNAEEATELAGTPLHMYVVANYFQCKINGKIEIEADVNELRKKWNLWRDSLQLYEQFLKHNMDKVFLKSDGIEVDEDHEIEKRREFFERHKKLALLAICKEEDLCKLLPPDEIKDLKNTINRIKSGEEKSALFDCVFNNVPKFFHIMYAEYCGVEILADLLKNAEQDSMDQVRYSLLWDFVVNIFLYSCTTSVRSAFDYKLKNDPELAKVTSGDHCKNIIFELLVKRNEDGTSAAGADEGSPLQTAVDFGMNNFVKVMLMSIETNLKKNNVKAFTKLLKGLDIFCLILNVAGAKAPTNFTQFFTEFNLDKVADVFKSEHTVELPMAVLSLFMEPNEVEDIRQTFKDKQQRLVNKAAENFGLTEDNVELFRRVAETIKRHNDEDEHDAEN